ncbi:hypothetical protein B0T19DRAFT_144249 [Cercophora scortea]|uniref:Uncharacterized protein n=1 Tax=Cercophora scortea TaxID=314031 RepID=A0AAE0IZ70_9PEZI|nr:hypothetical protein B0T19DRAFT_144249 [Cercophora scortea]
MANNQAKAPKDALHDEEERLEEALEHLKELHLKLRELRTAFPRMLKPLASKSPSPQASYAAMSRSMGDTQKEITSFREAMLSEETKKVFQKANDSRRANPKGIAPWRARDHPDWTSPKRRKAQDSTSDAARR